MSANSLREINLEIGNPDVLHALERVMFEIRHSRKMGVKVLKIIHGYGSSGRGGKIRKRVRVCLEQLQHSKEIKAYISGEEFSIFNEAARDAIRVCDQLRKDDDLERSNNGVIYIVL